MKKEELKKKKLSRKKIVKNKNKQPEKNIKLGTAIENIKIESSKFKEFVEKITKNKINIRKESSNDTRSYHVNSDKIKKVLKFKPNKTIGNAIKEIAEEFKKKRLKDSFSNINYFTTTFLLTS